MNNLLNWLRLHPLHTAGVLIVLAQLVTMVLAGVSWHRRLHAAAAQPPSPDAQPSSGRRSQAGAKRKTTRKKKRKKSKRHPAAVVVAALAAAGCTAYSGDTSWRFAEEHLEMHSLRERSFLFFAAELALFGCALMARSNMHYKNKPGAPGMLVWLITTVQVVPAYTESPDIWGGTVRAFVGPVLAAFLCHLALGLDLWHAKPGALSDSVPAVLLRELRERLLSRLGLADRGRDAEQITRDRATHKAVRLASLPKPAQWLESVRNRRLGAAVARAGVGEDPEQGEKMLRLLAVRRTAGDLTTMEMPPTWKEALRRAFPWWKPQQTDRAATTAGTAGEAAHPFTPSAASGASACNPGSKAGEKQELVLGADTPGPYPAVADPRRTEAVHARIPTQPASADAQPNAHHHRTDAQPDAHDDGADAQPRTKAPAPDADTDARGVRPDLDSDELLEEARRLDAAVRVGSGRNASKGVSLRQLQTQLHIGQRRAQRLQRLLKQDPEQW
ncbi:hypothetical protein ACFWVC_11880 [Streptomyces sp. NPDC058691]|uniref:hypothetical protein n=1 Tax=Streptomyces sp. NPDC058691 TaxID=3346601 RepID=UPI0036670128